MFKRSARGISVPEILVATAILGLIMSTIGFIFSTGLTATAKSEDRNQIIRQLTVCLRTLQRDLQQTTAKSVTVETISPESDGMAYLNLYNEQGQPVLAPSGRPAWQAYFVLYHDATEDKLYKRKEILVAGAPQQQFPSEIGLYNAGTGASPIASYFNSGQPIVSEVESFKATLDPTWDAYVDISISMFKDADGNKVDTRTAKNFDTRVYFRN